jgi:hypothetical protein
MEERVKRPKLARTSANRSVSSLLGLVTGDAGDASGAGGTFGDVVSRSVDLGYRVVEDYIRQGQKTAERMASRTYGQDAFTGDLQELGMRVMRYASEFMAVWFDFMERAAAGGGMPSPAPGATSPAAPEPSSDAPSAAPPREAARQRVRVEVTSPWPTEVELDLRPGTVGRPLVLQALRAVEPDKPRIDAVSFDGGAAGGTPTVRIRVPPEQPAGVYNALLIDEQTAAPAGTLSVRIVRDAGEPAIGVE